MKQGIKNNSSSGNSVGDDCFLKLRVCRNYGMYAIVQPVIDCISISLVPRILNFSRLLVEDRIFLDNFVLARIVLDKLPLAVNTFFCVEVPL